jgi:hypothetical protein
MMTQHITAYKKQLTHSFVLYFAGCRKATSFHLHPHSLAAEKLPIFRHTPSWLLKSYQFSPAPFTGC